VCTRGSNWALLGGPSTSPLDGMQLRQLVSVAYVVAGGLWLVTSMFAIRKCVVKVSWRSLASISLQRSQVPVRFWLVVSVHLGAAILLLWLGLHAV